ncbi:MAG: hypothetical protein AUG00_10630 [Candidatus Rokubacteria bacterium 13_1_20CM_2_70_7]|nr:MAG: hypothetical protein AUG00_10630 [Candidatus Rokubacteria bacterium 13_1_20CM_2_70_7]
MRALRTLAVACVAAWLGVMAFFSLAAAPLLFRTIERASAGQVVAALLPHYYRWGITLCVPALVALLTLTLGTRAGRTRHLAGAVLAGAMVALLSWALTVTLPAAEGASRAGDTERFTAAHRSAMRLNLLTMLCGAGLVALEAFTGAGRRDE